jgi:hypothetical protein
MSRGAKIKGFHFLEEVRFTSTHKRRSSAEGNAEIIVTTHSYSDKL